MNKLILAVLLCFAIQRANSQIIINKYAAVLSHPPCGNVFNVDDATGFGVGDTVLMIQMKGATIDSSNTASFGSILNYNGAGNYEFNVIKSVVGNAITLVYNLSRTYNIPSGRVQLVRVPYFSNYTVSQPHSCMPWNGSKGGITVIHASGTVTLNSTIDVSQKGFRNGALVYVAVAPCGKLDYYYSNVPNSSGAEKGEGITELSSNRDHGRGAQANGGGGGNSSNGGGGGGGNGGAGGMGGKETAIPACAPAQATGGLGGLALSYSTSLNKVFMGGGSGAGHANNNNGGNGTPGGGIILILANQLAGNGQIIRSDGGDGFGCVGDCWDGQPGGSAGGTVLLHVNSFTGNVSVSAKGGNGGSHGANNTATGANGPGGGGGGGVVWVKGSSLPSQVSTILTGGQRGVFTNNNDPWGTTDGNNGISLTGLNIVSPTDSFKGGVLSVNFKDSVVSCLARSMIILSPNPASGMTYNWDFGNGNTSTIQNPSYTFPGVGTYSVTLTITDPSGCSGTVTKTVMISPNAGNSFDTTICAGKSISLTATSGTAYSWSPSQGLNNTNNQTVNASPSTSTTYIATISAGPGCTLRDTFHVKIVPASKADFSYSPSPPTPNTAIQFTNRSVYSDTYYWTFGDGATSTEENPSHFFKKKGSFRVCLYASSQGGGCPDSVCKTIQADIHVAIGVPSAFTPNGDNTNDILFVRGGGVETMNIKIYNRWGQKVFESSDMSVGWDGTFAGKMQDIDIYAYVLTATFIDGSAVTRKGNINLLR